MPLSPNVETMINQAGSAVVEHVAEKNALDLTDDAALRAWTKRFADLVARYRSVVRLCTKNDKSYVESAAIKDAVTSADQFLMQHTHWTWDEQWVTARWIAAALERKRIWEAEEERIRLLKEKEEEEKLLAEAQALLNSNTFEYLTEEEWQTLRNDPPIEESPAPTVFNLFDPTFDPVHSSEGPGSPLSDLTSSVSSPATCVDPLSPSLSTAPLPIQKDDDVKATKQLVPVSVVLSKSPSVAPKPKPTRGGPAGRTGQRGRGGSATTTVTHAGKTTAPASAVRGSTTTTETAVKPSTDPPTKPLDQRLPEVIAPVVHKVTDSTLSSTTIDIHTPPIARKPPVKAKSTNPTTARDTSIFIPKNRPGPQTSQLRLPTASVPSPAVPNAKTTLPKLDTNPSRAGSKRKSRDEVEDVVDEESDEEDENSVYLMGCGGVLIGTGQINSPPCDPCASTKSKCFKLNGRSCCARCHQEHVKCPLDKPTTTPHLDRDVAPPEKPSLPKAPIAKRQKTNHVLAG